jgi:hypothetical protein
MTNKGRRTYSWTVGGSSGSLTAKSNNTDRNAIITEDNLEKSLKSGAIRISSSHSEPHHGKQALSYCLIQLLLLAACSKHSPDLISASVSPSFFSQLRNRHCISLGSGSVFSTSSSALCFPVQQDSLRSGRNCGSSAVRRHLQHRTYEFSPLVYNLLYRRVVYAVLKSSVLLFFLWRFDPITGQGLPLGGFAITLIGHNRFRRTPLDKWSARRRDLCLTTHNNHHRQISMPPPGFERTIPASERPPKHVLDRAATGIATWVFYEQKKIKSWNQQHFLWKKKHCAILF